MVAFIWSISRDFSCNAQKGERSAGQRCQHWENQTNTIVRLSICRQPNRIWNAQANVMIITRVVWPQPKIASECTCKWKVDNDFKLMKNPQQQQWRRRQQHRTIWSLYRHRNPIRIQSQRVQNRFLTLEINTTMLPYLNYQRLKDRNGIVLGKIWKSELWLLSIFSIWFLSAQMNHFFLSTPSVCTWRFTNVDYQQTVENLKVKLSLKKQVWSGVSNSVDAHNSDGNYQPLSLGISVVNKKKQFKLDANEELFT